MFNDHTHAPGAGRPEAIRIRTAMKSRTEEAPQQILATCLQEVSEGQIFTIFCLKNSRGKPLIKIPYEFTRIIVISQIT